MRSHQFMHHSVHWRHYWHALTVSLSYSYIYPEQSRCHLLVVGTHPPLDYQPRFHQIPPAPLGQGHVTGQVCAFPPSHHPPLNASGSTLHLCRHSVCRLSVCHRLVQTLRLRVISPAHQ